MKGVLIVGYKTLRNMLIEFGPSETLDSFILRPALMYAAQLQWGIGLGTLAGKLAADVVFFGLAILAFEMRKRYVRE